MGIISNLIAPTSSIIAQPTQSASQPKSDANSILKNAVGNAIALGQAAIVTLSASSKTRGASTGSDKRVDAAFDKEAIKEKKEKDEKEKEQDTADPKKVNTTA